MTSNDEIASILGTLDGEELTQFLADHSIVTRDFADDDRQHRALARLLLMANTIGRRQEASQWADSVNPNLKPDVRLESSDPCADPHCPKWHDKNRVHAQ